MKNRVLLLTALLLLAPLAVAQTTDPLITVLVNKGVLTAEEARTVSAGDPAQARDRLAQLLRQKGILSDAEYSAVAAPAAAETSVSSSSRATAAMVPAVARSVVPPQLPLSLPAPRPVIAAVIPIRVMPTEPPKRDGLIPDIKLGSGAKLKLYGLIKASAIYDSSSPYGTDMPLPGFINPPGDTGPDGSSEFHVKARFARVGAQFEWPDLSPKLTLTGKLEADFEGNFTRTLNRNISNIRSSQFSIRLAYGRLDYAATDKTTLFALFGQDWTPFGSSTLPNLFETTGLGLGFGTLYERAPQFKFGLDHNLGGSRHWHILPEIAVVIPAYGDNPADLTNQTGYGERQGFDSGRPDLEGRLVTQFQLDPAKGVAPAQVIFSFVEGNRTADILKAGVPLCPAPFGGPGECPNADIYKTTFHNGASVTTQRWGYSTELQLPTRYVTILTKYWRGADLRWFFVGDLLSVFNDKTGLSEPTVAFAPTIDGPAAADCKMGSAMCVLFGMNNGVPVAAPQQPVRDQGGFVNLGFPLGRIFGAAPEGRNAGWQLYLHYAYDEVFARDARRIGDVGNRNDLAAGTLYYKLNNWLTFVNEVSMYRTRTVDGIFEKSPLFRGNHARVWHDTRYEVGPIFSF